MARVFTGTRHTRVERAVYRLTGVNPDAEQPRPLLPARRGGFSLVGVRCYTVPDGPDVIRSTATFRGVRPWMAFNTAVELRRQHQLAVVRRGVDARLHRADGGPGGAELRLRSGRHGGRSRAGTRLRPDPHRHARQLLGRPDPGHPADPAADRLRGRAAAGGGRGGAELRRLHACRRSPGTNRCSPAARWPARRRSRSWAPTAAASSTPTPPTRSRTPAAGPTCSRSC